MPRWGSCTGPTYRRRPRLRPSRGPSTSLRSMRIAIDARAAAEVPAGRGRYVRELLRGIARRDDDHEYLLYARTRWTDGELDGRFRWVTPRAPGLSWPLVAGASMSRRADVALACNSYAMTLPWTIPGAVMVWDFAPFDRELQPPRGSLLERLTLPWRSDVDPRSWRSPTLPAGSSRRVIRERRDGPSWPTRPPTRASPRSPSTATPAPSAASGSSGPTSWSPRRSSRARTCRG